MLVEALYDHGKLLFLTPVKLVSDRFRLTVDIPAHELHAETPPSGSVPAGSDYGRRLAAELDAIRNAPLPSDDELPPPSERQRDRIEAHALREDR